MTYEWFVISVKLYTVMIENIAYHNITNHSSVILYIVMIDNITNHSSVILYKFDR
jgi:hypothetical protein